MNFTAFDSFLWCLDFALSAIGLFIVFGRHRNIWPLWALLAWRSFGDAAEFAAMGSLHVYAQIYYLVSVVSLLIEIMLAVVLCGELVREPHVDEGPFAILANEAEITVRHQAQVLAAAFAAIGAMFFLFLGYFGPLNVAAIIRAELVYVGLLGLLLIVGWLGRLEIARVELPEPWRGILAGTIALIFVQSLSFGLLARFGGQHWGIISRLQPVGEIAVLGMWIWSAWRPVKLSEVRVPLKGRVEA